MGGPAPRNRATSGAFGYGRRPDRVPRVAFVRSSNRRPKARPLRRWVIARSTWSSGGSARRLLGGASELTLTEPSRLDSSRVFSVKPSSTPAFPVRSRAIGTSLPISTSRISGRGEPAVGSQFTMHGGSYGDEDDEDPIAGSNGEIRGEWMVLDEPVLVAIRWRWFGPEGWVILTGSEEYRRLRAGEPVPRRVPRLDQPSTLTVQFADATTEADTPMTVIRLVHGDVPAEWIDDLTDFWTSKIDTWDWQTGHSPNWR
jgi:hypothetical protein